VHWNNLSAPVTWDVTTPAGVLIAEPHGEGPKPEEPADADPREFLIDVDLRWPQPVTLTVKYFACNDEEGWCKAVTQSYTIEWRADADGGWSQTRGRNRRANREAPDATGNQD
jgi:hypothetical protein